MVTKTAPKKEVAPPSARATTARGKVYNDIFETIGGTPLVRAKKFIAKYKLEADVLAKLEFFNPLGSIKDRTALAMVEAAEQAGHISPGKTTIIEASSGNMAISLAFVAATKGYKLIIVLPESVSLERRKFLLFYGAELVLTAAEKGMKGANEIAASLMKQTQDAWTPDQFHNASGPVAHAEGTAEEIWADTGGKVDVLICGVGTGATITGIAHVLKEKKKDFKAFAVEPAESPVLSGGDPGQHKIQGIGVGFKPPLLNKSAVDGVIQVPGQQALEMAREVSRLEGIPCGISSGANFAAALHAAQLPENKGKTIVVMVPSFAERYIASELFQRLEN
ncbi:MAG: cysteine synthase A [Alphaproteobacteria bacterium]